MANTGYFSRASFSLRTFMNIIYLFIQITLSGTLHSVNGFSKVFAKVAASQESVKHVCVAVYWEERPKG